jgi:hypothetical protein
MVQAFPPDGADDPFYERVLPRRTISGNDFVNAECLCPSAKLFSVNGISVTNKVLRHYIHTASLDKLLRSPGSGRMVGYIEMQDPTTVVAENDEHKKNFKSRRGNRKEIKRDEFLGMILEESSPALGRWAAMTNHVLRDGRFRDIDTQFQEFSVYSWRAP